MRFDDPLLMAFFVGKIIHIYFFKFSLEVGAASERRNSEFYVSVLQCHSDAVGSANYDLE